MGNFYLDIETTGIDETKDKIVTIQFQELDRYTGKAIGELIILKEWESSEKEILEKFIEVSGILNGDWNFVPVGFNLGFEHNFLFKRAELNGLPPLDILNKPFIDLRAIGILMNKGQFKGASLDNLTGKKSNGSKIPLLYKNQQYNEIIEYIKDETQEFLKFNNWLYKEMPKVHEKFKEEIGFNKEGK